MIINQINSQNMTNLNSITKARLAKSCLIFLLSVVLSSCGNESVRDTKNEPFIIMIITKTDDGKFIYSKGKFERPVREFFASGRQSIETDYDAGYKVGDTLCIGRKNYR